MVFLTSLQSIMPIVLLISLGYFLKGRGMFNDTFSSNLSRLIMSVILPVGVFMSVLHNVQTSDLWDLLYYIGNTISVWMFGVFLIEADPLPTNGSSHGESFRTLVRKFSWKKLLPPPLLGFFLALVFLYAQIPLPTVL